MKDYQTITLEIQDDVAVLRLNRADKMNALNTQMRAEITDAATEAARKARVLVMTGEGKAFCSGQDLSDSGNVAALDLERVLRDEYVPMLRAIADCPIPTISAVNGPAAGAGANLALAADVVIATDKRLFPTGFYPNWADPRCRWYLLAAASDGYRQGDGRGAFCRTDQRPAGQRLGYDLGGRGRRRL